MMRALVAGVLLLIVSCSSAGGGSSTATTTPASTSPSVLDDVATGTSVATTLAPTTSVIVAGTSVPTTNATTVATIEPTTPNSAITLPVTSTTGPGLLPTTSAPPSPLPTVTTGVLATPPEPAGGTAYRLPVEDGANASYAREHHDYPASDIFTGGCGTTVVAPVSGTLLEVRTENQWTKEVDNPATRGGKSISILGDDGVRYYLAHFEAIDDGINPGNRVAIGDHLGQLGMTGRAGACHLHFALSPPCPGKEWAVRRGVIWPWPYLDAWRDGRQSSPVDEVEQWSAAHPDACAEAMADPYAPDS